MLIPKNASLVSVFRKPEFLFSAKLFYRFPQKNWKSDIGYFTGLPPDFTVSPGPRHPGHINYVFDDLAVIHTFYQFCSDNLSCPFFLASLLSVPHSTARYRILADHLHPEHRRLMNHRHRLEDEAVSIYGKPKLIRAKAIEFLNMDYSETSLNPGQDWYIGGSSFLTLSETKEHLLAEMKYIKAAFKKLLDLKETVECRMSDLDLTGNLFEDVLNVEDLLAEAEIFAEEFTRAYRAINTYEELFRNNGGATPFTGSDDLPF